MYETKLEKLKKLSEMKLMLEAEYRELRSIEKRVAEFNKMCNKNQHVSLTAYDRSLIHGNFNYYYLSNMCQLFDVTTREVCHAATLVSENCKPYQVRIDSLDFFVLEEAVRLAVKRKIKEEEEHTKGAFKSKQGKYKYRFSNFWSVFNRCTNPTAKLSDALNLNIEKYFREGKIEFKLNKSKSGGLVIVNDEELRKVFDDFFID